MTTVEQKLIPAVARHIGVDPIPGQWHGIDAVLPLLERIRGDGATVLMKLDGARGPADNGPYTFLVSGGPLGDDFIRAEVSSLEHGIAKVIVAYARRCWKFTEPS